MAAHGGTRAAAPAGDDLSAIPSESLYARAGFGKLGHVVGQPAITLRSRRLAGTGRGAAGGAGAQGAGDRRQCGRDPRQDAAHREAEDAAGRAAPGAVRPLLREARPRHRATGAADRRARGGGGRGRGARGRCRSRRTGGSGWREAPEPTDAIAQVSRPRQTARAPPARDRHPRTRLHLSRLRRHRVQPRRPGRARVARIYPRQLQGDPAHPAEAELPRLRDHRAGADAFAADRARTAGARFAGPHRHREILRPPAAAPPECHLRA